MAGVIACFIAVKVVVAFTVERRIVYPEPRGFASAREGEALLRPGPRRLRPRGDLLHGPQSNKARGRGGSVATDFDLSAHGDLPRQVF
jgi:hypothetical protein